ncbi:tetratricopeptide repeat protein [Corallococcus interemptor]|uniref:tetratricopeptide repeat protein n=1 Tax=Corallococcus interemptor TaxID=2316720 RepID=UPI0035D433FB
MVKESYRAQWERSRAYLETGDLGLALQELRDALTLAPDDAVLWEEIFNLSLLGGLTQNALAAALRLRQLAPENPNFIGLHAMAALLAGKLTEALPLFEEVLQRDPESVEARRQLARALDIAGQRGRVRTLLEEAVARAPTDPGAPNDLAVHYLEHVPQEGPALAASILAPVLEAHPRDPTTHFNLALALRLSEPAKARHHAQQVLQGGDKELSAKAQQLLSMIPA